VKKIVKHFVKLGIELAPKGVPSVKEDVNTSGKSLLKDFFEDKKFEGDSIFEIVNNVCEFVIKDKAGDFIGSRMGRPEKAKLRKLQGSPNVLFPVGKEGGRFRSINAA